MWLQWGMYRSERPAYYSVLLWGQTFWVPYSLQLCFSAFCPCHSYMMLFYFHNGYVNVYSITFRIWESKICIFKLLNGVELNKNVLQTTLMSPVMQCYLNLMSIRKWIFYLCCSTRRYFCTELYLQYKCMPKSVSGTFTFQVDHEHGTTKQTW